MSATTGNTSRLEVVDALRGFALLAIVLLHNLEHYNIFLRRLASIRMVGETECVGDGRFVFSVCR